MPRDKKYIGLDLGSVTCGVSRSDTGRLAQPVRTSFSLSESLRSLTVRYLPPMVR